MKKLLLATALVLTPTLTYADTLAGVYVGGQFWDMSADGAFGTSTDLQEYDLEDETKSSYWIAIEHFIPLVPNLKLRANELDTKGRADVNNFEFNDIIFNGLSTINAELDHTDIIMYYEVLDNSVVSLDIGVNLKYAEYALEVTGSTSMLPVIISTDVSYEGVIPMLYAAGEVGLFGTNLDLYSEISWIGYDGSNAYDVMAGVKYSFVDTLFVNLDLRAGFRKFKLDVEDLDDIYADVEFDGAYAGLEFHF